MSGYTVYRKYTAFHRSVLKHKHSQSSQDMHMSGYIGREIGR